jgi:hypothetical protein
VRSKFMCKVSVDTLNAFVLSGRCVNVCHTSSIRQGFLGAAFAAVGFAVTQSMAGSGLIDSSVSIPLPSIPATAPKISASKSAAPKVEVSARKSKIAFLKGE